MRKHPSSILNLLAIMVALSTLAVQQLHAGPITFFQTINNTDFSLGGTGGLRFGSGNINISGVTGPVNQSYLWWHGPTNSTNLNFNDTLSVNGNSVTGTNIGVGNNNFWGYLNSQAYRASTTSIINGNGNYSVVVNNDSNKTTNGAGAAVFFNDGNTANDRDVAIFDGNDSNFSYVGPPGPNDPAGWSYTLNNINYSSGQAFLRLFVSDGQTFVDGTLRVNNQILAAGNIFEGNTLPGASPTGNGNLFDLRSFDISSFLTPGNNSLTITLDAVNDALSGVVAFIDLPSGSLATVPEPSSLVIFGSVAALGVWRRRRSATK